MSVRPTIEGLETRRLFTTLPVGFSETVVAGGLGQVTSMDLLPDGRLLVAQQNGIMFGLDEHGQRTGIGADDKVRAEKGDATAKAQLTAIERTRSK